MSNRNHRMHKAVLGLCWLSAGCGSQATPAPDGNSIANDDSKIACVTLAMATGDAAEIEMGGKEALLEIPASLTLKGTMSGGIAFVNFNRPQYGNLACKYEQEAGGALTLRGCGDEAQLGDWVAADRMSVSLQNGAAAGDDVSITACATRTLVPTVPDDRPLEDFRVLPNGDLIRPEGEGRPIESGPVEFGMTGELEQEYRGIAARDAKVKRLLGERFAYSYLETIDPPKGQERDSVHVKLWFFSHSNTMSVWVKMKNAAVYDSGESEVAIPEGKDEVDAAVEMARQDPALSGRLNDLTGGGMLAVPVEGASWLNHRVIEVHFYDANKVSKYLAMVDLTTQRVAETRALDLQD